MLQSQRSVFSLFKEIFSGKDSEDQVLPFPAIVHSTANPKVFTNESSSEDSDSDIATPGSVLKNSGVLKSASIPLLMENLTLEASEPPQTVKKSPADSVKDVLEEAWNYQELILDLLDYFSECGNPQINVYIAMTLSEKCAIPEEQVELYTLAYLDLLYGMELWPEATKIICQSKIPSILSMNGVIESLLSLLTP